MASFKDALDKIAEGLKDLSSLEVVTYKGTIDINAVDLKLGGDMIAAVLANAKTKADFRLLACTYFELDADTTVFFDKDITADERAAHQVLVESALSKRDAVVTLFKDAIVKQL